MRQGSQDLDILGHGENQKKKKGNKLGKIRIRLYIKIYNNL